MTTWDALRTQHSLPKGVYLDTCANGLMAQPVIDAGIQADQRFIDDPSLLSTWWMSEGANSVRDKLAPFLKVSRSTLALVPSFSTGINYLLPSLLDKKTVMILDNEYPSLALPFTLNGYNVLSPIIPPNECSTESILSEIDRIRPDIVAISHIQWLSGFKVDLKLLGAFCRAKDIMTIVDTTQSFGAHPLSPEAFSIDVVAASGYKWAVAGFGNGFLYCAPSVFEKMSVKTGGYSSFVQNNNSWSYEKTMKSFEPGHSDHVSFSRLSAAIDRIEEIGLPKINARISALSKTAREKVLESGHKLVGEYSEVHRSSIFSILPNESTFSKLEEHNVCYSKRGGAARIGIHYYNNDEDIRLLFEALS